MDWPTRDGSGIRDYIHVWDLARAHLNAVERFDQVIAEASEEESQYCVINLGTGKGVTVRELVSAFEQVLASACRFPSSRPGRAMWPGRTPTLTKPPALGWKAELPITQGISDALKWGKVRDSIIQW